jgi:SAM-dependent methyltransferase
MRALCVGLALCVTLPIWAQTPEADHGHGHRPGHHHRFSNAEQWSERFDDPKRDAWQRPAEVVTLIGLGPGMTVADLGAGTGYFLPHLSRAVGPHGLVLGLDVEPDMVRFMAERSTREGLANAEARLVAPDDPGLEPASVDRVLIVNTWHHLDDRPAYAARLRAALAEGGAVCIVDYTREAPFGPPARHRLTPEEVMAELAGGGLDPELLDEQLPHQYVVLGRAPERNLSEVSALEKR